MIRFALVLAAGMAFAQTNDIGSAREAMREAEASYGPQHPATAMMIRNLALAFAEAGYNSQAEHYAQQALTILEARFGASDVTLVPALNVLTEAYAAEGRYTEAVRTGLRAVAIGPEAGAHYAVALHNVAAVLERQGKRGQAVDYYKRALAAGARR
jgi:tetratricopeptide (TPR) repeat protein